MIFRTTKKCFFPAQKSEEIKSLSRNIHRDIDMAKTEQVKLEKPRKSCWE